MPRRSLGSDDDRRAGQTAVEDRERRPFLSIPDTKTPWLLLDLEWVDGFTHWVKLPGGRKERVTCLGDPETSNGFDPDTCAICAHRLALYAESKEVGETEKNKPISEEATDMRAKYEAHFLAVRGVRMPAKDRKTGKRIYVPDFDIEDDDSEVEAGILSLSHAQFLSLTGLVDDENCPHIKTGEDLGRYVLWSAKKAGKGKYKDVIWSASKIRMEAPEVEITEAMDTDDDFIQDDANAEKIDKVIALLRGESSEDVDSDEEVDMEGDSEDVDDDYFEDDEAADEAEEDYDPDEDAETTDADLDYEAEDDDFEDDIPGEDEGDDLDDVDSDEFGEAIIGEEEETEMAEQKKGSRTPSATTTRKKSTSAKTGTTRKPAAKKSGTGTAKKSSTAKAPAKTARTGARSDAAERKPVSGTAKKSTATAAKKGTSTVRKPAGSGTSTARKKTGAGNTRKRTTSGKAKL